MDLEPAAGFLIRHEVVVRLAAFVAILVLMGSLQAWFPRRALVAPQGGRWLSNLGIVFVDALAVRFLLPVLPFTFAILCRDRGWGLLSWVGVPPLVSVVIAIVLLDAVIYVQHRIAHSVGWFWRLHATHHSDVDLDVTTGNRFHPLEILISAGVKLIAVFALGPLPEAMILFEVILNGTAQFNHSNVRIPKSLDRVLRWFVVTPDMHRVHHSVIRTERDSNYGFNLAWWDRLLGTYGAQPSRGHEQMTIGLPEFRDPGRLNLYRLLLLPFSGKVRGVSG